MTLRGAQRRLAIVLKNVALQSDSLALTEARRNAGLAPELDVVRAVAQLSETRAEAPPLEAEVDQSVHALSVLLGRRHLCRERARTGEPRTIAVSSWLQLIVLPQRTRARQVLPRPHQLRDLPHVP